jgi:hypothetical protein
MKFRDVVVLGELIFRFSNPENLAVKPRLVVRDFFAPSKVFFDNVNVKCRRLYIPKNTETFRCELQDLFLEFIDFQRESIKRMGIKSILA